MPRVAFVLKKERRHRADSEGSRLSHTASALAIEPEVPNSVVVCCPGGILEELWRPDVALLSSSGGRNPKHLAAKISEGIVAGRFDLGCFLKSAIETAMHSAGG